MKQKTNTCYKTFLCMLGKLAIIGWLKSGNGRCSFTKVSYIREVDIVCGVTLRSITSCIGSVGFSDQF